MQLHRVTCTKCGGQTFTVSVTRPSTCSTCHKVGQIVKTRETRRARWEAHFP